MFRPRSWLVLRLVFSCSALGLLGVLGSLGAGGCAAGASSGAAATRSGTAAPHLGVAPSSTKEPTPSLTPPKWDDPGALRHLWSQGAGLALAGRLCPYVFPTGEAVGQTSGQSPSVQYVSKEAQDGPLSVHVYYGGTSRSSFGVGCLKRFDVSRYLYLSFWIKGTPGQRVRFRLRDADQTEAIVEKRILQEGWHRMTIPTNQFAQIDLRALASFGVVFDEDQGQTEFYLDNVEFMNQ